MGKDLKGKELGVGITQEGTGLYSARFVDKFGKRKHKRFKKLQECRAWLAETTYINEHNYTERYRRNIKPLMGKMPLSDVKPLHCQKIFYDKADQGYRTSTIYQARIKLFNMLEYAKQNEGLCSNLCKRSVKSDMGKPSEKKVALTKGIRKIFLEYVAGQSCENQYRFILQTGFRTGELIGLKWEDVDFETRTIQIRRSMEYRYSVKERCI